MRQHGLAALLVTALACCAASRARAEADAANCVWRVTLRAVPDGELDDALWREAANVEEAKAACVTDAATPRRCAGFVWRAGRSDAAGLFLPLPFERVAPLHRADAPLDVYQHACWPLDGPIVVVMTTMRRPDGVSYVVRAARAVLAEGLPLLLADANAYRSSEAADWALSLPGGVRYVRAPETSLTRVEAAIAARDAHREKLAAAAGGVGVLRVSRREQDTDRWRWKESLDWAWAVSAAVSASDAAFVLYMEDDVVLAVGAADGMVRRLAEWAARGGGAADVAAAARRAAELAAAPPPPVAARARRGRVPAPPPWVNETAGWMGLSLWSADDLPDGHPCDNCYTKALLLPRHNAAALAAHVDARFTEKPVDWLLADVERAGGARLRALVPSLAEHVGDQSSLRGVRREWQRSAYFKHVPFVAAGEPPAQPPPPRRAAAAPLRRAGGGA